MSGCQAHMHYQSGHVCDYIIASSNQMPVYNAMHKQTNKRTDWKRFNWDELERAPSLLSSTVALSVYVVRPFGHRGKFWRNILVGSATRVGVHIYKFNLNSYAIYTSHFASQKHCDRAIVHIIIPALGPACVYRIDRVNTRSYIMSLA